MLIRAPVFLSLHTPGISLLSLRAGYVMMTARRLGVRDDEAVGLEALALDWVRRYAAHLLRLIEILRRKFFWNTVLVGGSGRVVVTGFDADGEVRKGRDVGFLMGGYTYCKG